jgi:hypothetical protein
MDVPRCPGENLSRLETLKLQVQKVNRKIHGQVYNYYLIYRHNLNSPGGLPIKYLGPQVYLLLLSPQQTRSQRNVSYGVNNIKCETILK